MISDQIGRILKQREYQNTSRRSEPRYVRLEPRQILSISVVGEYPEDNCIVYAKIKNRLFKGPEIIIVDEESGWRNLIDYEIPSPCWAKNNEFLYWIHIKSGKRVCTKVTLSATFDYVDVVQQPYIRVHYKSGDDLLIYPKDRGEYVYVRDKIDEMMHIDKPMWIKI